MTEENNHSKDNVELRRQAEEQLGENRPPFRTEEDPLRLLHELQVHQIELEMQNVELRKVRDELETALDAYTDLYEFSPAGVVNQESGICQWPLWLLSERFRCPYYS
jgi:hypothetical protein